MLRLGQRHAAPIRVNQIVRIDLVQRGDVAFRQGLLPFVGHPKYFLLEVFIRRRIFGDVVRKTKNGSDRQRKKKTISRFIPAHLLLSPAFARVLKSMIRDGLGKKEGTLLQIIVRLWSSILFISEHELVTFSTWPDLVRDDLYEIFIPEKLH